jgi:hypothetical protein
MLTVDVPDRRETRIWGNGTDSGKHPRNRSRLHVPT